MNYLNTIYNSGVVGSSYNQLVGITGVNTPVTTSTISNIVGTALGGSSVGMVTNLLGIDLTSIAGSTLGSVLENGFDMSCWNSSYSPSEAKAEAPVHVKQKLELSGFLTNPNTQTLNQFRNFIFQEVYGLELQMQGNYASCTEDGWKYKIEYMKNAAQNLLDNLIAQGFSVQSIGQQKVQYLQGSVYGQNPILREKTFEAFSISEKTDTNTSEPIVINDAEGNVIAKTETSSILPLLLGALLFI